MLQSRRATEAPSDLTIFDRQVAWIKWQQQQDNTNYERGCVIDNSNETHGCQGNIWPQLAMGSYPMLSSPRLEGGDCSPLSKKRKVGVNRTEENSRMKKAKTDGEAVVELKREMNQTSNEKGESESSGEENSKVSAPPPPQKTDYIHVRARRGQATDSHSLAERVRREKISERMKYLQDLVPGCNKITGKAGMLDEIINYVQSLQRQVEFLSMKLAAAHPRLDFSIDQLITKEINQACGASFPTVAMSSETGDPSYLQFNLMGDAAASCGIEPAMNPSELELRRTASMLTPVPDVAVDSSFNAHGTSFAWDNDMMNLYNVEFHQGRGFSFPFQLFQGSMVPNNAKMEF